MEGWIKLHRKTLDNPIVMKDSAHFAVWAYLLLNATHAEKQAIFKGKRIVLQPGQLITGCISISDKLKLNESKVRRVLNDFQNDGQIDRQTSNKLVGTSDIKKSDVPTLTETEALSAANDVSEKRGFPEELKKAFNRWVTYKYTRGDTFKNYYAVDKVGQAIESHSKDYAGRVNERSTNQVVKLIDYCITTNTKSVCWSQIYSI